MRNSFFLSLVPSLLVLGSCSEPLVSLGQGQQNTLGDAGSDGGRRFLDAAHGLHPGDYHLSFGPAHTYACQGWPEGFSDFLNQGPEIAGLVEGEVVLEVGEDDLIATGEAIDVGFRAPFLHMLYGQDIDRPKDYALGYSELAKEIEIDYPEGYENIALFAIGAQLGIYAGRATENNIYTEITVGYMGGLANGPIPIPDRDQWFEGCIVRYLAQLDAK